MSETHSRDASVTADIAMVRFGRWLLYATLLVPVVVFPGFLFPFVTIRAVYFRVLVEIAAGVLLYVVLRRDVKPALRGDVFFWALLAWVGANTLAAVFGVAALRSLFGDHERMGGVWFWVHLLAYYAVLRAFLRPEDWRRFLTIAVAVAAVVAGYGLLQLWFPPFYYTIGGIGVGVTVGNSGLLAVYLLASIAVCAMLAVRRSPARLAYVAIGIVLVAAVGLSGNRSSVLALLIGAGAAFAWHTAAAGKLRGWRTALIAILVVLAVSLPLIGPAAWARPLTERVPVLQKLSLGVDHTRLIQWRAAVHGIRERPLFGVGPENYQVIWARYYDPEMFRYASDARWDRAHNAYLEAFATAGVLGFLSLLVMLLSLGWIAVRAARAPTAPESRHSPILWPRGSTAIAIGFFVAYAVCLFFWFFDLNSTMILVALAAFVSSQAAGRPLISIGPPREKRWQTTMVLGVGAVALISVIYVHGFETLRMASRLSDAGNPRQPLHETLADFESIFASPAPLTQHAFLLYAARLRDLSPRFEEIRRDPARALLFDRAFTLAAKEFERQSVQDRWNERLLIQYARVLILGAYYYGDSRLYEAGLNKLRTAVELAPRRVNTLLALGVAYLNADRPAEAMEVFRRAYSLYPPMGQTHAYIAETHAKARDYASAATWLRSALALGHSPDRDLIQAAIDSVAAAGDDRSAANLAFDFLRSRVGPPFVWASQGFIDPSEAHGPDVRIGTDLLAFAREDSLLAERTAELLVAAGDTARARVIRQAAPALCRRPVHLRSLAASPLRRDYYVDVPACGEPWRLPAVF